MKFATATLLALTCSAFLSGADAPSFIESSTFFNSHPYSVRNGAGLSLSTAAGDYYIAGRLAIEGMERSKVFPDGFPEPVGTVPGDLYVWRSISYVAHFSPAGRLLEWRGFFDRETNNGDVPLSLALTPAGDVAIVMPRRPWDEPITPGTLISGAGGPWLVVLSPDLRQVRLSAFLGFVGTSLRGFEIAPDGSFLVVGAPSVIPVRITVPDNLAALVNRTFVARFSADMTQIIQFRAIDVNTEGSPTTLARSPDGKLWFSTATANPNLPVIGSSGREFAGTNVATWTPGDEAWSHFLRRELLYVDGPVKGHPDRPGLYISANLLQLSRSNDFGQSWQMYTTPASKVEWALADASRMYAWDNSKLAVSDDEGYTWTARKLPDGSFVRQLAGDPKNANRIAVLRTNGDLLISEDAGETWRSFPVPDRFTGTIAFETLDERRLLWFGYNYLAVLENTGEWRMLHQYPRNPSIVGVEYHTGSLLSARGEYDVLYLSRNGGETWERAPLCAANEWCRLIVNPGVPDEWWLLGSSRMWRSTDAGTTWSEPIQTSKDLGSLAFSGREPGPVLASTTNTYDIYLRRLDSEWRDFEFATYLGGRAGDATANLLFDEQGRLIVVANTRSVDYPGVPRGSGYYPAVGITRFDRDTIDFSVVVSNESFWSPAAQATLRPEDGSILWCGFSQGEDHIQRAWTGGYDLAADRELPSRVFGGTYTHATSCAPLPDGRTVVTGAADPEGFPIVGPALPDGGGTSRRSFVTVLQP